jgi:5-methylcytosine-specific restriction endonuclease McrBC regulatory subunit McrC
MLKWQAGIKSRVMTTAEMNQQSRDQAIAYLQQVKEDEDELLAIMPELPQPGVPVVEEEETGDQPESGEKDEGDDE